MIRISAETAIVEAARLLAEVGIDTLLVDTVPATEITESDIVRAIANGLPAGTPVIEAVRERPLFVDRNTTLDLVVEAMIANRRSSVVVIEGDVVLGMLTLDVAVTVLLEGPPWLGALRVALRIDGGS